MDSVPSKILIRAPNWLGDLVMSTGFIRAILENFKDSQVDLIIKSGFEDLPIPHRGEIILFDNNKISAGEFGKSLRKKNYDCFYVLPPSFSSAWMAFQSKIPKRIGYSGEYRSLLLSSAKKHVISKGSRHLLKEYLDLISNDLEIENYVPRLEVTNNWIKNQLDLCNFQIPEKYVVFTPGAVYGPSKKWPLKNYRELGEKIYKSFGYKILLLGTNDDIESGLKIAHGNNWTHNYCGETSLAQLLAILTKAQLLVGNDSGSMHLMAAIQRPQIAIFGSTSPNWTGPINANATVISRYLACSPCFSRSCRFGHYDCLTQINPKDVFTEVEKHLSKAYYI